MKQCDMCEVLKCVFRPKANTGIASVALLSHKWIMFWIVLLNVECNDASLHNSKSIAALADRG